MPQTLAYLENYTFYSIEFVYSVKIKDINCFFSFMVSDCCWSLFSQLARALFDFCLTILIDFRYDEIKLDPFRCSVD